MRPVPCLLNIADPVAPTASLRIRRTHRLPSMQHSGQRILPRRFTQIPIMRDPKLQPKPLGPQQRKDDDIRKDTSHEDTNDLAIFIPRSLSLWRQREPLSNGGLNRRRSRGHKIAQLIRCADHKGSKRPGTELHEMDRNDAPRALHAELLEKRGRHDPLVGNEGIRVEQRATNHTDRNDREASPEDLRYIPHHRPTRHGAQIRHNLGDGDGVRGEIVLVLEHEWVDVLRAVRHEIEPGHQQHEIDEEKPVFPNRHAALG